LPNTQIHLEFLGSFFIYKYKLYIENGLYLKNKTNDWGYKGRLQK